MSIKVSQGVNIRFPLMNTPHADDPSVKPVSKLKSNTPLWDTLGTWKSSS